MHCGTSWEDAASNACSARYRVFFAEGGVDPSALLTEEGVEHPSQCGVDANETVFYDQPIVTGACGIFYDVLYPPSFLKCSTDEPPWKLPREVDARRTTWGSSWATGTRATTRLSSKWSFWLLLLWKKNIVKGGFFVASTMTTRPAPGPPGSATSTKQKCGANIQKIFFLN